MNMVDEYKQELLIGNQDLREENRLNEYASLHQRSGVVCGFDPRANKACVFLIATIFISKPLEGMRIYRCLVNHQELILLIRG